MIDVRSSKKNEVSLNITPLVDIVFLLLIFFLLTAFFIQPEGVGVKLPEAKGETYEETEEITVVIDKEGKITMGGKAYEIDALKKSLETILADAPRKTVVIKADRGLALQRAVEVMAACKDSGAARLVIATEPPD